MEGAPHMTSYDDLSPLDQLLVAGLDDWISLVELRGHASEDADSDDVAKGKAMALIRTVLGEGLMLAGDYDDSGFISCGLESQDAAAWIERTWSEFGDDLLPGDVCWFGLTERGAERAMRNAEGLPGTLRRGAPWIAEEVADGPRHK